MIASSRPGSYLGDRQKSIYRRGRGCDEFSGIGFQPVVFAPSRTNADRLEAYPTEFVTASPQNGGSTAFQLKLLTARVQHVPAEPEPNVVESLRDSAELRSNWATKCTQANKLLTSSEAPPQTDETKSSLY